MATFISLISSLALSVSTAVPEILVGKVINTLPLAGSVISASALPGKDSSLTLTMTMYWHEIVEVPLPPKDTVELAG